jgi:RNA polymerase sigma factor (sigma-70 family)
MSSHEKEAPSMQSLFLRHAQDLRRFLSRHLKNASDVDDCLQDTFIRIWHQETRGKLREDARGYLFTTALNLARNKRRSDRARQSDKHVELSENGEILCSREEESDFYWKEALRLVDAELKNLRPSTRMVFLMHYAEHLAFDQIATQLGISKRTVEREIVRALDHIKTVLGNVFGDIAND